MPASGPTRVLAVDWSGDLTNARRKIWLCEVGAEGVTRLENGRSAAELVHALVASLARSPHVVVGFDFAFSFPEWFASALGADARAVWSAAARHGSEWLREPRPPFWKDSAPGEVPDPLRRTERAVAARVGSRPSSVFKLVGAGQVGRGSVRGMPFLLALAEAGAAVWPFDDVRAGTPLVVEIWPRLCYGEPVRKSRRDERAAWVARHAAGIAPEFRAAAESSDDAFDALAAGLAMWRARATFTSLPPAHDARERLEGRIWEPPASE